jgi:hypothetical protein
MVHLGSKFLHILLRILRGTHRPERLLDARKWSINLDILTFGGTVFIYSRQNNKTVFKLHHPCQNKAIYTSILLNVTHIPWRSNTCYGK